MKRGFCFRLSLLANVCFFGLATSLVAAPDNGWLAQPGYWWQAVSSGQYVSSAGPTFSHLHNGTTPNESLNTVQKQVFDAGVGPTSLSQTTTLQLTNFEQQTYGAGTAQLGDLFWAPVSATLHLQAFYGASDVGVEFIGGISGNRTSFNVTFQQELDWLVSTYNFASSNNTLRSYTWLEDDDAGDGNSYESRFGYGNTDSANPWLQFQRSQAAGGIINAGTDTYVMQDGTVVRNPTIGIDDNQETLSADNPGDGGGPGRVTTYAIPLGDIWTDGSLFDLQFFSEASVDIVRNWGEADGRFHANPSFSVQATLTVNYDTWEVIPEPSTGLLLGLGTLVLAALRRKTGLAE